MITNTSLKSIEVYSRCLSPYLNEFPKGWGLGFPLGLGFRVGLGFGVLGFPQESRGLGFKVGLRFRVWGFPSSFGLQYWQTFRSL